MSTLEQTLIEMNCQTSCWKLDYKYRKNKDKDPFALTKNFSSWLQEVAQTMDKKSRIMTVAGHTVFFESNPMLPKCQKVEKQGISEAMEDADARTRSHFELETGDITGFELDELDWENLQRVANGETIGDDDDAWLTECGLLTNGELSELGKAWLNRRS